MVTDSIDKTPPGFAGKTVTEIVHIADVHIRSGDRERSRHEEYSEAFAAFLDRVRRLESCAAGTCVCVVAGDVFHNKGRIDACGGQLAFQFFNALLELMPVLVICGNHDMRQDDPTQTDAIEFLATPYAGNPNFVYLAETGAYAFANLDIGVVAVKDTLRLRNTSGVRDDLCAFPDVGPRRDGRCRVAVFHGTVQQSALPSSRSAGDVIQKGYSLDWFAGYDVVLLGDNHKQQVHHPADRGWWGYPGSLIQQDFGEPLVGHGAIVWRLEDRGGVRSSTFIEVPNRMGRITATYDPARKKVACRSSTTFAAVPERASVRCMCPIGCEAEALAAVRARLTLENPGWEEGERKVTLFCCAQELLPPPSGPADGEEVDDEGQEGGVDDDVDMDDETEVDRMVKPDRWIEFVTSNDADLAGADVVEALRDPSLLAVPSPPEGGGRFSETIVARNTRIEEAVAAFQDSASFSLRKARVFLTRMTWSNLLCYGEEPSTYNFERGKDKIVQLAGKNGTGKSSFMDVLLIALFGQPASQGEFMPTGEKLTDRIVHMQASRAYVELDISVGGRGVGGRAFRLRRSFVLQKSKAYKALASVVAVSTNEELVAEGVTMVGKWVLDHVGTLQDLQMSSVLAQTDASNFFHKKSADQKLILEKALRLERVSSYEAAMDESLRGHSFVLRDAENYRLGLADSFEEDSKTSESESGPSSVETEARLAAEIADLERQLSTVRSELQTAQKMLGNDDDVDREPAEDGDGDVVGEAEVKVEFVARSTIDAKKKELAKFDSATLVASDADLTEAKNEETIRFKNDLLKLGIQRAEEISSSSFEKTDDNDDLSIEGFREREREIKRAAETHASIALPPAPPKVVAAAKEDVDDDDVDVGALERHLRDLEKLEKTEADVARAAKEVAKLENAGVEYNEDCAACRSQAGYKLLTAVRASRDALEAAREDALLAASASRPDPSKEVKTMTTRQLSARIARAIARKEREAAVAAAELHAAALARKNDAFAAVKRLKDAQWTLYRRALADVDRFQSAFGVRRLTSEIAALERRRARWVGRRKIERSAARVAIASGEASQADVTARMSAARCELAKLVYIREVLVKKRAELADVSRYVEELGSRHGRLARLRAAFSGIRSHIYTHEILPTIEEHMNRFLSTAVDFRVGVSLAESEKSELRFRLLDRGCSPPLERASGFQKFMVNMAMRATLTRIGAVGDNVAHLFLDEGFVACDAENLARCSKVLRDLAAFGGYESIVLMTHLETVEDAADLRVDILRPAGERSSRLLFT